MQTYRIKHQFSLSAVVPAVVRILVTFADGFEKHMHSHSRGRSGIVDSLSKYTLLRKEGNGLGASRKFLFTRELYNLSPIK